VGKVQQHLYLLNTLLLAAAVEAVETGAVVVVQVDLGQTLAALRFR
jgi:hypothetical protein